jgi:hypothetical protein
MSGYATTKAWREKHPDINTYRAEEARKWRLVHPELAKEIRARHHAKHLAEIRRQDAERHRRKRANDPEGQRERMRRFKAKKEAGLITLAGRPRPSICELCGDEGENGKTTVFDHNHANEKFRGWLCDRCNRVLGSVKDSVDLLSKMIAYLNADGIGYGEINGGKEKQVENEHVRNSGGEKVPG